MAHRAHITVAATLLATGALAATSIAQTSHEDWPKIQTKPYLNTSDRDATHSGSRKNDELLGGHGRDILYGLAGDDVIWGDYKPTGNTPHQRDRLYGGPGDDWIYGSHGRAVVYGGPGRDTIRVWFGRGFVDCGDGRDILYLSRKSDPKVKRRNCEKISHKSARQVGDG
jgi:RTX calcium-binding nonapeptide repeat (4 copies)